MARPLRIEFEGALYHVTLRGNARQPIFLKDSDRSNFLDTLAGVVERYRWICHAYYLMVETPEANLSRGIRQLNGVYTKISNRRHGRVGHLFQGRYKAVLVEKESYLLELARYVVLNPVRAGLVSHPGDWRRLGLLWSNSSQRPEKTRKPGMPSSTRLSMTMGTRWERWVNFSGRTTQQSARPS